MATRAESDAPSASGDSPQDDAGTRDARGLRVEIAWVDTTGRVERRNVALHDGATIADALGALCAHERDALRAAIASGRLGTAIYGGVRDEASALHDADRIELVGELNADPKVARRMRVQQRRAQWPRGAWKPSR